MSDQAVLTSPTTELDALRRRVVELEALEAERRRAERVQSTLYRIADTASAVTDMRELYAAIHHIVGELMYANNFFIVLYDEARQMVSFPFVVDEVETDFPDPQLWEPIGKGFARGLSAYVLRSGQPTLVTAELHEELIHQGEVEPVGVKAVDWLGVPLKVEGHVLGVVAVQSYTEDIRYTEQDRELLTFVAQHIATALNRVRAVDETRQRNAELEIINSVQQGLASQLDFQAIIDLVGDKIRETFQSDSTYIALYDPRDQRIRFPYFAERDYWFELEARPLGVGLTSRVIELRAPLSFGGSVEQEQQGVSLVITLKPGDEKNPTQSYLGVPMLAGSDVMGVVSVQSYQSNAYRDRDVRLLSTLAASMTVALENARLFDETKRLLAESEQRAAELAMLNSVGEAMTQELDVKTIARIVGDKVRDIFDVETTSILLLDQERC